MLILFVFLIYEFIFNTFLKIYLLLIWHLHWLLLLCKSHRCLLKILLAIKNGLLLLTHHSSIFRCNLSQSNNTIKYCLLHFLLCLSLFCGSILLCFGCATTTTNTKTNNCTSNYSNSSFSR